MCLCVRTRVVYAYVFSRTEGSLGKRFQDQGKAPSTWAHCQAEPVQIRLAHKREQVGWPKMRVGSPSGCWERLIELWYVGLRQQVAAQTSPAMLCYLRARTAGSSACQADTRPGLKALEQKRRRSAMGRVRRQNMDTQEQDGEADLLGAGIPGRGTVDS